MFVVCLCYYHAIVIVSIHANPNQMNGNFGITGHPDPIAHHRDVARALYGHFNFVNRTRFTHGVVGRSCALYARSARGLAVGSCRGSYPGRYRLWCL